MSAAPTEAYADVRFKQQDRNAFTRAGLIPKTDVPYLEKLRRKHEKLIAQRDEAMADQHALAASFDAEDHAHQAALDRAYETPGSEPEPVERTSREQRESQLNDAQAHVTAATRALITFGMVAVGSMAGELPARWHAADAVNSGRVPPKGKAAEIMAVLDEAAREQREIIARAQKELAAADRRVRELVPLRWWLVRFANGGQIGGFAVEPGTDLDVPPTHTYFAKPEGAADPPGWPSRTAAGEGVMQPIEGDEGIEHAKTRRRPATPSTSEEEIVDLSDPWFADAEGNPNPSTVN